MRSLSFAARIALRYLWSGRRDAAVTIITIIAILGVTVGVITLNVVMAVMTGFEVTLREKILGADAHVIVRRAGGDIPGWQEISAGLMGRDPKIMSISPYTSSQALLRTDTQSMGVLVRGIAEGSAAAKQLGEYVRDPAQLATLFAGTEAPDSGAAGEVSSVLPGIVIGRELARALGLFTGSTVSLLSPQVSSSPFGLMPRFRRFRVAAIYQSGLVEYENGVVYLALPVAQQFFRLGNPEDGYRVSGLEVRLHAIDEAPAVAAGIVINLGDGFFASPWTETNKAFFEALRLEKRVYFIVLLLIVVMASFSIVSSLVMIVVEKRKDIGILRTLGASSRCIAWIFRIQGGVIGGIGVILGTVGGVGIALGLQKYGFPIDERIFQMSSLPIHLDPLNVALVALSAFAICAVATHYPARKASSVEPIEVLRHE